MFNTLNAIGQIAAKSVVKGVTVAKATVKAINYGVNVGNTIAKGAASMAQQAAAQSAARAAADKARAAARAAEEAAKNRGRQSGSGGSSGGGSGGGGKVILIQWHNVTFYTSASEVRGFDALSITGNCETEDVEDAGAKYVKLKNTKGYEIGLTAIFDKRLGTADVKGEAIKLAGYAAAGQTGYFYSQGQKLVTTVMMLTSAKVENIQMTPGGSWFRCEVKMTLKSSSKMGNAQNAQNAGAAASAANAKKNGSKGSSTASVAQKAAEKANVAVKTIVNGVSWAVSQSNEAKKKSSETEKTGITARANQVKNAKKN